jgi:hypothetical protein
MTTTLFSEKLMNLYEAARRLPPGRGGSPVSFSCVYRWVKKGAPGPDGSRVRLEAVRVGGRWITSEEALQRFSLRLTPVISDDGLVPVPGRAHQRAPGRTAELLNEAGI